MTFWQKLKSLFSVKDMLFTVVLFGLIIGIACCKADTQVQVTFSDTAVDVVSARYAMNIPYELVERIQLVEYDKDDTLVKGTGDISLHTGTWTNAVWGEYFACVDLGAKLCIKAELQDGRLFVFSRKSDQETTAVFETFQTYLNQQQ